MRKTIGLSVFLLLSGASAHADALLTCKDSFGHEVFEGYIGTEIPVESARISRDQEILFTFAVPQKPVMGLDRATFKRKTGIDLKTCMGPYAKIYKKQDSGKVHCASGKIKALAETDADDAQILEWLGLPKEEAACSVIFSEEKALGLSSEN